jgi:hypothetical protein
MDMLAIESESDTATFTILGKNFGSKQGSVHFLSTGLNKVGGVRVSIKSWKDTEVQIVARSLHHSFTSTRSYPKTLDVGGSASYEVECWH